MPHADPAATQAPLTSLQASSRGLELPVRAMAVVALLGATGLTTPTSATADARTGGASAVSPAVTAPARTTARRAGVTLEHGSRGALVRSLQRKLGVRADGRFGSRTRSALKRWQRRHGAKADGIAGPATLAALGIAARAVETATPPAGVAAVLAQIALCESGGDLTAVSANGRYRGKYQFSRATWRDMGGAGDDPAGAPEAEQDRVAALLYAAQGLGPWPACGHATTHG